jgi:hypothetical protein
MLIGLPLQTRRRPTWWCSRDGRIDNFEWSTRRRIEVDMYLRFAISDRDEDSQYEQGVFAAIYEMEDKGELAPHELIWFREIEKWFDRHLRAPNRLTRSRKPNSKNRAISWLKSTAVEHVSRMRAAAALLEYKGVPVKELFTERPGYIVYEDEYQVAAVPFGRETF